MTDNVESQLMPTSGSLLEFYMTKDSHFSFMAVLALTTLFLLCTLIVQFWWNKKRNTIFNVLIKKILSQNHKKAFINVSKNGQMSQNLVSQAVPINSQNKEDQLTRILSLDPAFQEMLKESVLYEFLNKNSQSDCKSKIGWIKNGLKASKCTESFMLYQPFLILCVLILSFSTTIVVTPLQWVDEISNSKTNVAISMLVLSLTVYLFLNAFDVLAKFINYCQSKKFKKNSAECCSIPNSNPTATVSSGLKEENMKPNAKNRETAEIIQGGSSGLKKAGVSFKLKNSLNLLHLVYLIPLLVAIGILCAARL